MASVERVVCCDYAIEVLKRGKGDSLTNAEKDIYDCAMYSNQIFTASLFDVQF
jgi:hypothetical protein